MNAFNVAFAASIGYLFGGILGATGDAAYNAGLAALGGAWATLAIIGIVRRTNA